MLEVEFVLELVPGLLDGAVLRPDMDVYPIEAR